MFIMPYHSFSSSSSWNPARLSLLTCLLLDLFFHTHGYTGYQTIASNQTSFTKGQWEGKDAVSKDSLKTRPPTTSLDLRWRSNLDTPLRPMVKRSSREQVSLPLSTGTRTISIGLGSDGYREDQRKFSGGAFFHNYLTAPIMSFFCSSE